MIATLDARRLALEVAGRWRDEEEWGEAVRDMRAKVSAAEVRCDEMEACGHKEAIGLDTHV